MQNLLANKNHDLEELERQLFAKHSELESARLQQSSSSRRDPYYECKQRKTLN
jgi:hypothetical protein